MLCTYFTSYRVVSLRAAWVTFDTPGWLDRDPYGIHTSSLSYNNNNNYIRIKIIVIVIIELLLLLLSLLLFLLSSSVLVLLFNNNIRPVARKGYGSIAHEAKPNGLLFSRPGRAKGLIIVLVSPNYSDRKKQ